MENEKIDSVCLTATPDGNFHIDLPDDDGGDRLMSNAEISLLAFFMRVSTDFEWVEELLEWFDTKAKPLVEAENDNEVGSDPVEVEGAAV